MDMTCTIAGQEECSPVTSSLSLSFTGTGHEQSRQRY